MRKTRPHLQLVAPPLEEAVAVHGAVHLQHAPEPTTLRRRKKKDFTYGGGLPPPLAINNQGVMS